MQWGVITLFPAMFSSLEDHGITGRACQRKLLDITYFNPRDYTQDKHRSVDDRPYGGGPGMVMCVEPLLGALQADHTTGAFTVFIAARDPVNPKTCTTFVHTTGVVVVVWAL